MSFMQHVGTAGKGCIAMYFTAVSIFLFYKAINYFRKKNYRCDMQVKKTIKIQEGYLGKGLLNVDMHSESEK